MKKKLLIIALMAIGYSLHAQDSGIGFEEINITKEREVKLQKANRVFEKIPVEKKEAQKKEMVYTFFEKKLSGIEKVDFKPTVISPVDIRKSNSDEHEGYANYFKVGAGNFGRLFAETHINTAQDRNLVWGVYGLHNAAKNGPVEGAKSGINLDQIKLDGKYHANNFELKATAGFERRNYYFFGYDTTNFELEKEELRQRLNIFDVGVSFENTNPKPVVDYALKTNLKTLNDFYEAEEVDWGTKLDLHFPVVSDKVVALLESEAYVTQRTDSYFDNPVRRRNLFRVNPSFNLIFNQFNAKIGFKAVNEYDEIEKINATKGYPSVTLTYKLPSLIYFFAGYDGDIIRNTLGSMLDHNPWLKPQVNLLNTRKDMEIFIGSRGDLFSGVRYDLKASYGKFNGLYYFNTYDGDPKTRKFDVFYESGNTNFVNVSGEVNYSPKDFWRAHLMTDYWYYQSVDFDKPYHRPAFKSTLSNTFVASEKIVSNIDVYFLSNSFAKDPFKIEDVKLPAIADINAEFTYLFSNQFSAFVKLNNLLGKNYQRYLNYPQQGLNFLVGINVAL